MKNDLHSPFKDLSSHIKLSASEKDFRREQLRAFMNVSEKRAPIVSPFFNYLRYSFVGLLVFLVSGTGVSFAAEGALPGDLLYPIKLNVTEPLIGTFAITSKDRAEYEADLADKRLVELALASSQQDVSPEDAGGALQSFSEHLSQAHKEIATVREDSVTDALRVASTIQSSLEAHSVILEQLDTLDSATSTTIRTVSDQIESSLDTNEAVIASLSKELSSTEGSELTEALDDAQKELANSVEGVERAVSENPSLDSKDRAIVTAGLAQVTQLSTEAQKKETAGDIDESILLYTKADQKADELQTLIEADKNLGVDISGTSTSTATSTKR